MDGIFDRLVTEIILVIAGVLSTQIAAILYRVFKKLGISLSAEKRAEIELYIADQIRAIAETQAAIHKGKLKGQLLSAEEKLYAVTAATLQKFPQVSPREAEMITQATLGRLKEGALVGAVHLGEAVRTPE